MEQDTQELLTRACAKRVRAETDRQNQDHWRLHHPQRACVSNALEIPNRKTRRTDKIITCKFDSSLLGHELGFFCTGPKETETKET
eukprot:873559-Amphidinium_carterae.3